MDACVSYLILYVNDPSDGVELSDKQHLTWAQTAKCTWPLTLWQVMHNIASAFLPWHTKLWTTIDKNIFTKSMPLHKQTLWDHIYIFLLFYSSLLEKQ